MAYPPKICHTLPPSATGLKRYDWKVLLNVGTHKIKSFFYITGPETEILKNQIFGKAFSRHANVEILLNCQY